MESSRLKETADTEEYLQKHLREKKRSMDLSNQKEVKEINKTRNTSTEKEILRVLQARHHFPQPSILCAICKRNIERKQAVPISRGNIQCINIADGSKKKSICTMVKSKESLLAKVNKLHLLMSTLLEICLSAIFDHQSCRKWVYCDTSFVQCDLSPMENAKAENSVIKLMTGEQMHILNNDFFNQEVDCLKRKVGQVECTKPHKEIIKTSLQKVSKLEKEVNAVLAVQEETSSAVPVPQVGDADTDTPVGSNACLENNE